MKNITYKYLLIQSVILLLCSNLYAQLALPIDQAPLEEFDYKIPLKSAIEAISEDIAQKNNFMFKDFSLTKMSNNSYELTGEKSAPFLYLIELSSPITQIALDELKEKTASISYTVTLKAKDKETIAVSAKINSFKIKEDYGFEDMDNEGLVMYAKNIKLGKNNFSAALKKYFRRSKSATRISLVEFSREKGFDNYSYQFKDFVPKTNLGLKTTLIQKVPKQKENDSILVIYSGVYSYSKNIEPSLLYGFDMPNQTFLWTHIIPNNQRHKRNQFNVHNGTVYIASEHTVQAIDPETKTLYWSVKFPENSKQFNLYPNKGKNADKGQNTLFNQKAQASGDYVFVNDEHYIYCLNRYTGALQWAQEYGRYGYRDFRFDDTYVYKSGVMEMFKIHKQTGEVDKILHNNYHTPLYNDQFYDNNILVFGDERGHFVGYDTKNNKVLWDKKLSENKYPEEDQNSPTSNQVFWRFDKEDVVCYDALTGNPLHFIVLNEERSIKNPFQNENYIIIYFSIEYNKELSEDVIYVIEKEKREIVKKWFIDPKDRPISNFDDSLKNKITYLSEEAINVIDLSDFSIKTYENKIIKQDSSLSYYNRNYHIDWALPK